MDWIEAVEELTEGKSSPVMGRHYDAHMTEAREEGTADGERHGHRETASARAEESG